MFGTMGQTNVKNLGNGGTMDGDVTITGDLTVSGGISLSLNEVLQGTSTIDITDTEALLVRKDGDGGDVFIVDTTNSRVGIGGTPHVNSTLNVKNSSGTAFLYITSATDADSAIVLEENSSARWIIGNDGNDSDKLKFGTGGGWASETKMTLTSGGSLGIGESSSVDKKLHIKSSTSGDGITIENSSTGASVVRFEADSSALRGLFGVEDHDGGSTITGSSGYATFIRSEADIQFASGGNNLAVTIDSSQNVGIGTASPSAKIHVSDTADGSAVNAMYLQNLGTSASSEARLFFSSGANTTRGAYIGHINTSASGQPADLTFATSSAYATPTERMRIDSSGHVGIGVAPDGILFRAEKEVNGNWAGLIKNTHATNGYGLKVQGGDDASVVSFTVRDVSNNSLLEVLGDGKVGIGNSSPVAKIDIVGDRTINLTNTTSDDTNKNAVITHSQYDSGTETEGFLLMQGFSNSSTNRIDIGGGNSQHNATTEIKFHTASNSTTATGTARMVIDDNSRISLSNNDSGGTGGQNSTSSNTIIGYKAGNAVASGTINNTFIGHNAGLSVNGGVANVVVGTNSADALTTGDHNVALGYFALSASTDVNGAIAIGSGAMESGNVTSAADGSIAIGRNSLLALTSGGKNVALGYLAGSQITTGNSNVALGHQAMDEITTGDRNIAIGHNSIGNAQGGSTSGDSKDNIAIGYQSQGGAWADAECLKNVSIGSYSLDGALNGALQNTAVGYASLGAVTQGDNNVAVGMEAGDNITTGTKNITIGQQARTSAVGGTNQIVIGATATGQADNSVTLGNASVTDVYMAQDSGAYVHSQSNQNHVANTMSSPYYRFDGTDDYVEIADSDNLSFGNGTTDKPFSVSAWIYMEDASDFPIISKGIAWTNAEWFFSVNGSDKLDFTVLDNSATAYEKAIYNTALTSYENKWIHVSATYSGVGGSSANAGTKLYVNGTEVATTLSDSGTYVAMENTSAVAYIGRYSGDYSQGSIAGVQIHNRVLSATEVKELYSGMSVSFKYKGANQTNILTGVHDDFDTDVANQSAFNSNYSQLQATGFVGSGGAISVSSNVMALTGIVSGHGINGLGLLTKGKKYRMTFNVTAITGNWYLDFLNQSESAFSGTGLKTVEWTAGSSDLNIYSGGSGGALTIDASSIVMELVPIGAVAEYNGSGITANKWYDGSGNELHGTVSGASAENTASAPVLSDNHPAFLVQPNAQQNNIAVDTVTDIVFDVERFDQGSNFASNTFTAPVTGKYFLNVSLYGKQVDSASDYIQVYIVTSNRTYTMIIDPDFGQDAAYWSFNNSVLADMDVNDTAKIQVFQSTGSTQLDIGTASYFSGYLVC